ncbi:MAG TPA: glycoside hydrolase family 16 protein [Candidatus Sulfotelmatobacter sp.]|nr:glycoside hydrolase family 16 protein [Candidatus Sulfotelmatobacter sp.]
MKAQLSGAVCLILISLLGSAQAQTITWSGRSWKVTTGGMAGVAKGDPANVTVDDRGYLHLSIVQRDGKWTAAELFTLEKFRFGTYQWVVQGDVYDMDKSTVLGLFPYGPVHKVGADAEDEIDIEFSKWNNTCHGCNADFTVYPSTGNRKPDGSSAWEDNFHVEGKMLTTARIEWASDHIVFTLMNGSHPIGTTADVIKTETYSSDKKNIPQEAVPVGINLWCFRETPARNQAAVIHSFEFSPK